MTIKPTNTRRRASQARSRATVDRILASAADLVATRGGDRVTMTEIAQKSGVVIGSLYQYFSDKSEIIEALLIKHNAEVDVMFAGSLSEVKTLEQLIEAIQATYRTYFDLHQTDPLYRSIWSAVQTDAALQALDVEDTLSKARILHAVALPLYREVDSGELMAACALILQLALAAARFALALPEPMREPTRDTYQRMSREALLGLERQT
jgi:AcrR family transcriptional regulator